MTYNRPRTAYQLPAVVMFNPTNRKVYVTDDIAKRTIYHHVIQRTIKEMLSFIPDAVQLTYDEFKQKYPLDDYYKLNV